MAAYDKPTLVYFNIMGRGEPIRMTFAACGVEYDEQSVPYGDMKGQAGSKDWPFMSPYGTDCSSYSTPHAAKVIRMGSPLPKMLK